jgi:hypothetical protein
VLPQILRQVVVVMEFKGPEEPQRPLAMPVQDVAHSLLHAQLLGADFAAGVNAFHAEVSAELLEDERGALPSPDGQAMAPGSQASGQVCKCLQLEMRSKTSGARKAAKGGALVPARIEDEQVQDRQACGVRLAERLVVMQPQIRDLEPYDCNPLLRRWTT